MHTESWLPKEEHNGMAEEHNQPGSGQVFVCSWCSNFKGVLVKQKHGYHARCNWGRITRWWECCACGARRTITKPPEKRYTGGNGFSLEAE